MGRPEKLDLIPAFLDASVTTPTISVAARRVGLSPDSVYRYLVRSRLGDEKLQNILWHNVEAPFHVHLQQNVPALIALSIRQSAMDRALNGTEVPVFYQGVRMTERVKKQEFADIPDDELWMYGSDDDIYEVRPTMQHLKPSDALTLRMLEAYDKRFRSHQEISVSYGGVLRLERPDERTTKTIDATPQVFEEDAGEAEQQGAQLALARPAKSSEEMDKWAQQGEFDSQAVRFVNSKGETTVLQSEPKTGVNLAAHPRAYMADTGRAPGRPVPHDPGKPRPTQPLDAAGIGRGRVPDGGFKVA